MVGLALVPKEPERSLFLAGNAKREKTTSTFIVAKLVWPNRRARQAFGQTTPLRIRRARIALAGPWCDVVNVYSPEPGNQ